MRRAGTARVGGGAPQVVEHDVDVPGGGPEPPGHLVLLAAQVERFGAERVEEAQAVRVAARADDARGSEPARDLYGEPPGVPGGAEDEDGGAGGEVDAAAQRDPGGHGGVHPGGDGERVRTGGERDGATAVDEGAFGQGAEGGVGRDEVEQFALLGPPHAVDAGDEGQLAARGVVTAVGGGADAGVQPGGEDVDEHVAGAGGGRGPDLLAAGRGAEGADEGGAHEGAPSGWRGTRGLGAGRARRGNLVRATYYIRE
nr:hypothetical protein [Streptomyces sp. SA3_actF]